MKIESSEYFGFMLIHDDNTIEPLSEPIEFIEAAKDIGWQFEDNNCDHFFCDGTEDCDDCGKSATSFLSDATQFLEDNIGVELKRGISGTFNVAAKTH